jgi:hypothetical protein
VADGHVPESLLPIPHGLDFSELKDLVEYLERIQGGANGSLTHFRFAKRGFAHKVAPGKKAGKTSKASTATCLAYLKAIGRLELDGKPNKTWSQEIQHDLRSELVNTKKGEWTSARLPKRNPFTVAFLLEAIKHLGGFTDMEAHEQEIVETNIQDLNGKLAEQGGLSIKGFPKTAFLTQKALKSLKLWGELSKEAHEEASTWNWSHLYEESMLIASDSPDADYLELAYAVLTASHTTKLDQMTPRERLLLRHAISQFFSGQRPDGTWPKSRPLFLYPRFGNAYCYDYELLVQMLSERQLRPFVMPHLEKLRDAAGALDAKKFPLDQDDAFGWASEHHGGERVAESWPTASVFHFCFELSNLVYEAVRRDVFEYVDAVYEEPKVSCPSKPAFDGFLDSRFNYRAKPRDFKEVLANEFVVPLQAERDRVRAGWTFESARVSAILYGAPGTSKTRLAKMIAKSLGWPLLTLDPSHLTRKGLDNVHAETDAIFGRLQLCDQLVVLMDEFDELVREREASGELRSRFLTTAMLPKIADLHARKRIVYIVGTNHLEQFDAAISRRGRFDLILPVMPPTAEEKYDEWATLRDARDTCVAQGSDASTVNTLIEDLTFGEAEDLAARLEKISAAEEVVGAVKEAAADATLYQAVDHDSAGPSWKALLGEQESKIRGLEP